MKPSADDNLKALWANILRDEETLPEEFTRHATAGCKLISGPAPEPA